MLDLTLMKTQATSEFVEIRHVIDCVWPSVVCHGGECHCGKHAFIGDTHARTRTHACKVGHKSAVAVFVNIA